MRRIVSLNTEEQR